MARPLLARTAGVFLLAVLGARAVVNTQVVRLDTRPASHVSPGTVTVRLAAPGAADDGMTLDAPALVPGDTVATPIELIVNGSSRPVTLTTMATSSSLLDQDPVHGLQLAIDRCPAPWEARPGTIPLRYRCPGRSVPVLAPRPVLASSLPLLDAVAGTQHLLLSLTLPASAGNEFQGLSSTIRYAFGSE